MTVTYPLVLSKTKTHVAARSHAAVPQRSHTAQREQSARIPTPPERPPHSLHADQLLADYRLGVLSRQLSHIIRREVHNGRARFGVSGDGKELAQLAMAHAFQPGDFRAGYYRDQTFVLALGMTTPRQLLAQLYAHADTEAEPVSGGRSMIGHFGTRLLDEAGRWLPQIDRYNSSADISPTAGQMPRLVGLAHASRLYREVNALKQFTNFSHNGSEVAFGTIGNASCAEGVFWEALNAIGVLRAPAVISIWDDEYGISVPNALQFAKGSIAPLLEGFRRQPGEKEGFDLYSVRGWEYPALLKAYRSAAARARSEHIPAIIHVTEMTQPLGHSSSGSHTRYKSPERLVWEEAHDPLVKMREWLLAEQIAAEERLDEMEAAAQREAEAACSAAWDAMVAPIRAEAESLAGLLDAAAVRSTQSTRLETLCQTLRNGEKPPLRKTIVQAGHRALQLLQSEGHPASLDVGDWLEEHRSAYQTLYSSHQHSQSEHAALRVPPIPPTYAKSPPSVRGYEILQSNFDAVLAADARVLIFGEDVGKLGDVNQGVAGLQDKYGEHRVADTGIREATIIGQAIGLAQRGLRPIAEIQYIDYILYALYTLSDDLACLHWRTGGGQKAPVIVRSRGHRLEGIWHAGSPMGALLHLLRGMYVLVPRNMTQAAGFYNTLLRGDDPALVIESLNGYRRREPLPTNLGEFTVPVGVPETLRPGEDVTLVTYGATCAIALEAARRLAKLAIEVEVIDVQSLLPFDIHHTIVQSLARTSRVLFLDEDVPGGASAYMMQQVLEVQNGYRWLDSKPCTLSAQPHRPAFGADGEYFSKPNVEDVVESVYALMSESDPRRYPPIWERKLYL